MPGRVVRVPEPDVWVGLTRRMPVASGLLALIVGAAFAVLLAAVGYLTAAMFCPVRQAAGMAGRLADGDLGTRMPVHGVGEIGVLERSFNTMAGSSEESRAELTASRARIGTAGPGEAADRA
jgi:nitrogen fixation/metabolism regulation signal transduction histidine kinase